MQYFQRDKKNYSKSVKANIFLLTTIFLFVFARKLIYRSDKDPFQINNIRKFDKDGINSFFVTEANHKSYLLNVS